MPLHSQKQGMQNRILAVNTAFYGKLRSVSGLSQFLFPSPSSR